MRLRPILANIFCLFLFLSAPALCSAQSHWLSVGPEGGDARSLAADPTNLSHLYLGTANSWIYQSMDDGVHWMRLARLGMSDDLVIDHIVVDERDPQTLYAGVWQYDGFGGGVYVSHNSGQTWVALPGIAGQSVRALTEAPSNSHILVAGTLNGVFRTLDSGLHWSQISPVGSTEIHNVQSIAIDPTDPDIIYAGTWHLPWKTTDGGLHWRNIKDGIITDSDVFSILIDPTMPSVLYASACSGIYRSDNSGMLFRKIQGIPTEARRTRSIKLDPSDHNTVYAGTTEGLYKSLNGGTSWTRMTNPYIVINDIWIDPRNPQHILMATDQGGVLVSHDGGTSFLPSNSGISEHVVSQVLVDSNQPDTLYAGIINGKQYGGVYVSHDFGNRWMQQSVGLNNLDVFALMESATGNLYAGTNDGIYRWADGSWQPSGSVGRELTRTRYEYRRGRRVRRIERSLVSGGRISTRVNAFFKAGTTYYASTAQGLYRSDNQGVSWQGPIRDSHGYVYVGMKGGELVAIYHQGIEFSTDGGLRWQSMATPSQLPSIDAATISPDGTIWVGGLQGVYESQDAGATWSTIKRLPVNDISSLTWSPQLKAVLLTSGDTPVLYAINPANLAWKWWYTGWLIHSAQMHEGRFVAASNSNGVVLQPVAPGGMAPPVGR